MYNLFRVILLITCTFSLGVVGGFVYVTQVWLPNTTVYTTVTNFTEAKVVLERPDYPRVELDAILTLKSTREGKLMYGTYSCSGGKYEEL